MNRETLVAPALFAALGATALALRLRTSPPLDLSAIAEQTALALNRAETPKMSILRGGITNLLYVAEFDDGLKVLSRVYGEGTGAMIDRGPELEMFKLFSDANFGPKLLGLFEGGRVEQFFEDSAPLEPLEMGDHADAIAVTLRKMHDLSDVARSKLPDSPQLWVTLEKFKKLSLGIPNSVLSQEWLNEEIDFLTQILPSDLNASGIKLSTTPAGKAAFSIKLCHNDLLSGNILHLKRENRLQFLDFEYGSFNFVGFDFGNHFNEYAGFDFDLEKDFPILSKRVEFYESYLSNEPELVRNKTLMLELDMWVLRFSLASHYMWACWAIIQMHNSKIDEFDFEEYARMRRDGYDSVKRKLFN